jgi:glutaredoxin
MSPITLGAGGLQTDERDDDDDHRLLATAHARDYVMPLGRLRAPVVIVDGNHWTGYRPDRIKALVEP